MGILALLLGPPLLAALLALITVPYRRAVGWANAGLSMVSLGAALALGGRVLAGDVVVAGWQDLLRVDALSALLAACVSAVAALAAWLGPGSGAATSLAGPGATRSSPTSSSSRCSSRSRRTTSG